ncbi:hypothetical protein BSLG_008734 [Batrachochytrium salamandrivorans]|nr:hypothetical protein BSLG_008734 [Batrachochytrium salamandrivorans]
MQNAIISHQHESDFRPCHWCLVQANSLLIVLASDDLNLKQPDTLSLHQPRTQQQHPKSHTSNDLPTLLSPSLQQGRSNMNRSYMAQSDCAAAGNTPIYQGGYNQTTLSQLFSDSISSDIEHFRSNNARLQPSTFRWKLALDTNAAHDSSDATGTRRRSTDVDVSLTLVDSLILVLIHGTYDCHYTDERLPQDAERFFALQTQSLKERLLRSSLTSAPPSSSVCTPWAMHILWASNLQPAISLGNEYFKHELGVDLDNAVRGHYFVDRFIQKKDRVRFREELHRQQQQQQQQHHHQHHQQHHQQQYQQHRQDENSMVVDGAPLGIQLLGKQSDQQYSFSFQYALDPALSLAGSGGRKNDDCRHMQPAEAGKQTGVETRSQGPPGHLSSTTHCAPVWLCGRALIHHALVFVITEQQMEDNHYGSLLKSSSLSEPMDSQLNNSTVVYGGGVGDARCTTPYTHPAVHHSHHLQSHGRAIIAPHPAAIHKDTTHPSQEATTTTTTNRNIDVDMDASTTDTPVLSERSPHTAGVLEATRTRAMSRSMSMSLPIGGAGSLVPFGQMQAAGSSHPIVSRARSGSTPAMMLPVPRVSGATGSAITTTSSSTSITDPGLITLSLPRIRLHPSDFHPQPTPTPSLTPPTALAQLPPPSPQLSSTVLLAPATTGHAIYSLSSSDHSNSKHTEDGVIVSSTNTYTNTDMDLDSNIYPQKKMATTLSGTTYAPYTTTEASSRDANNSSLPARSLTSQSSPSQTNAHSIVGGGSYSAGATHSGGADNHGHLPNVGGGSTSDGMQVSAVDVSGQASSATGANVHMEATSVSRGIQPNNYENYGRSNNNNHHSVGSNNSNNSSSTCNHVQPDIASSLHSNLQHHQHQPAGRRRSISPTTNNVVVHNMHDRPPLYPGYGSSQQHSERRVGVHHLSQEGGAGGPGAGGQQRPSSSYPSTTLAGGPQADPIYSPAHRYTAPSPPSPPQQHHYHHYASHPHSYSPYPPSHPSPQYASLPQSSSYGPYPSQQRPDQPHHRHTQRQLLSHRDCLPQQLPLFPVLPSGGMAPPPPPPPPPSSQSYQQQYPHYDPSSQLHPGTAYLPSDSQRHLHRQQQPSPHLQKHAMQIHYPHPSTYSSYPRQLGQPIPKYKTKVKPSAQDKLPRRRWSGKSPPGNASRLKSDSSLSNLHSNGSDGHHHYNHVHGSASVGVRYKCEACETTDSPEWRRGPHGRKTLCNACGLRYARVISKRKEIRALNVSDRASVTGAVVSDVASASTASSLKASVSTAPHGSISSSAPAAMTTVAGDTTSSSGVSGGRLSDSTCPENFHKTLNFDPLTVRTLRIADGPQSGPSTTPRSAVFPVSAVHFKSDLGDAYSTASSTAVTMGTTYPGSAGHASFVSVAPLGASSVTRSSDSTMCYDGR